MEFGLFTEFHCPAGMSETVAFAESMAQMRAAEDLHFDAVCVMPKPFQRPHPPLRVAATTEETYPLVGRMGLPLFVAPRTISISDLERFVRGYHEGWTAAGHAGCGDIGLSMPVYVAATERQAREEPEASTMHFFRAISEALKKSDGTAGQTDEARSARAGRLAELTYADVLSEQAVFGTPEAVVDRLLELREALGFSSLSAWMNPGGQIPHERVLASMRLFAERVAPRLT